MSRTITISPKFITWSQGLTPDDPELPNGELYIGTDEDGEDENLKRIRIKARDSKVGTVFANNFFTINLSTEDGIEKMEIHEQESNFDSDIEIKVQSSRNGVGGKRVYYFASDVIEGGNVESHPFQIVDVSSADNLQIKIRRGTINSVIPTFLSIPMPSNLDDAPAATIGSTTTYWLQCNLDSSDQSVTSASITTSEPTVSETVAKQMIGTVDYIPAAGQSPARLSPSNQVKAALSLASCGENHTFGRV